MYDAYICVPQTLTLMLVCMMHISMILDSCMYEARMVHASTYDAIFFGNGHTFNGRSSSSSRSEQGYYGVGIQHDTALMGNFHSLTLSRGIKEGEKPKHSL